MVAKKDETAPEAVEATETAPVDEVAADAVSEAPATPSGPGIAGERVNLNEFDASPANICVECGSVWPIDKGVASCPACGGKTKHGFKYQAKQILAEDDARFTGATAQAATKKPEGDNA